MERSLELDNLMDYESCYTYLRLRREDFEFKSWLILKARLWLRPLYKRILGDPIFSYWAVYDSDRRGRRLPGARIRVIPCQSWSKIFMQCLNVQALATPDTANDTTGNSRAISAKHANNLNVDAAATVTTYGIVVGTGTNPKALADEKLQTQVTTNLAHAETSAGIVGTSGSNAILTISRAITNNTGSQFDGTEVALYGLLSGSSWKFNFIRDLLTITILNTATKTVQNVMTFAN